MPDVNSNSSQGLPNANESVVQATGPGGDPQGPRVIAGRLVAEPSRRSACKETRHAKNYLDGGIQFLDIGILVWWSKAWSEDLCNEWLISGNVLASSSK